jgi:hypothetical protein
VEKSIRKQKTIRGGRLLRAREVDKMLIQDRASNMEIVGSDVEALYPSLNCKEVAEVVFKAIMETEVKFEGVDYMEGARYIAVNSSAQD